MAEKRRLVAEAQPVGRESAPGWAPSGNGALGGGGNPPAALPKRTISRSSSSPQTADLLQRFMAQTVQDSPQKGVSGAGGIGGVHLKSRD